MEMSTIPVMRPKLPVTERLAPYLDKIDSRRIYSNFGPLAVSLEERLAAHFGLTEHTVVTVGNATLGLTLALMAQGARAGTLCVMPAWTFVASPHAATMAGLTPYFVDVDRDTWALSPGEMDAVIAQAPSEVGAIMPVAPFGQPIDVAAWDRFRARTGVPVVIDAAAGFDALVPSATPAVVSLHATKVYGVGEGGFVISSDRDLIRAIRTRANFGFYDSRLSAFPSANAKLSEYHAAVGHAGLDEWDEVRGEWVSVATAYRTVLPESNRIRFQPGFGLDWVSATCVMILEEFSAPSAERALNAAGVETRRWWGNGAHAHPATSQLPRAALPTTEMLAQSTLALPFYRDLSPADVGKVVDVVRRATQI